jgi:hypothetical protein
MALAAAISTLLLHEMFIASSPADGAPGISLKRRVIRDVEQS